MVVRANKVYSAEYFTDEAKKARYFLSEENLGSRWISGDARFGVHRHAEVNEDHLARLFAGQDQAGRSLLLQKSGLKKRVSSYELSVSAPKSVSAAWALATADDRAKIELAFAKALDGVATHVCRSARTRLGHNGHRSVSVIPNIAAFIQPDTRPVLQSDGVTAIQPQIHGHLVIPSIVAIAAEHSHLDAEVVPAGNNTETPPFKLLVRALDAHAIFNGAKSWGAVSNLVLATELQKIGYSISEIGENGTFEIQAPLHERDQDRRLRKFWSQRRVEIEADLAELGLTTDVAPAMAASAAVRTRLPKSEAVGDHFSRWREEADRFGLDVERFTINRQAETELTGLREAEIAVRMRAIPRALTEREATFDSHDLVREVATALVGTGAELQRIDEEIAKLIATNAIVEIGSTDRVRVFSTSEMIEVERSVVRLARELAAAPFLSVDEVALKQRCAAACLSQEQTAAAATAVKAGRISYIEGRAGVGKTYTLVPLCRALQKSGVSEFRAGGEPARVIAAGVSWRTARILETELSGQTGATRVEGRALDSWLKVAEAGGRFMDANTVLLLDEVSQVDVRAMHSLLREVKRVGGKASVLFLGDRSQVLPVNASSGISCVTRCIDAIEIAKVVRQTDPQLRQMVEGLAKGDVQSAVSILDQRGDIREVSGRKATIAAAVDQHLDLVARQSGRNHLLICKSNTTRLAIDAEVRRRMRLDGELGETDVKIDAVTPSGRAYRLSLARGDRIRFGIRCTIDGREVINGTTGLIRDVIPEHDGHALILASIQGRECLFSSRVVVDEQARGKLATDYAITTWSCQGLTSDTSVILAETSWDARDTYVALSRAKSQSLVVVNTEELALAVRGETGFDRSSDAVTREEKLAFLTRQMSRWRVKSSTLDWVGELADPVKLEQIKERSWEAML